ncbi:MAG TPA: ATP-binding protein, partial [Candidatus Kapabacteria bacterium]|nr:ATP-binding protein [Candidatus Kapabacteria bacterium]
MKASRPNLPKKLKPEQLGNFCSENIFAFKSTADIEPLDKIVGQERAMKALELGVSIKSPGYNVFVSGLSGTGRLTTIQHILENIRPKDPELRDFCYVNNFLDEDKPRLITLPKGQGVKFRKSMQVAIQYLRHRIPQMFESEQFLDARKKMIAAFQEKERKLLNDFDQSIRPKNFVLGQVQLGNVVQPEVMPIIEGKPVPIEEVDEMVNEGKMSIEDAKKWSETYQQLKEEFIDIAKHGVKLSQDFQHELEEFEKQSAELLVSSVIDSRRSAFPYTEVRAYLNEVEDSILSHLALFKGQQQQPQMTPEGLVATAEEDTLFRMFAVNLILDTSQTDEAPVIIETQPTYTNIFGTIEKVYDARGVWVTDFTRIKAGSLLRANGGYLIINALDALTEP